MFPTKTSHPYIQPFLDVSLAPCTGVCMSADDMGSNEQRLRAGLYHLSSVVDLTKAYFTVIIANSCSLVPKSSKNIGGSDYSRLKSNNNSCILYYYYIYIYIQELSLWVLHLCLIFYPLNYMCVFSHQQSVVSTST